MGEAKQKQLSKARMLKAADRCVYCSNAVVDTVEHMPPTGLFKGNQRPRGWMFACCNKCNSGTSGADALLQFISMLSETDELDWKTNKAIKLIASLRKYAPGVVDEILGTKWSYGSLNHNGVFLPKYHKVFDGPFTKEYLDVFSAKLAMSAFKEFIGRYVDIKGRIYTEWFLNYTTIYDGLKDITEALPDQVSMKSDKGIESPQFTINYQTDCKSIVIGLAKFHNNAAIAFAITDHEEAISILETFDLGRPTEHNTDALFIERFVNKAKL